MIVVYAILESPHRWSILAGISLGAGILGAVIIIAYGWSHWLARIWFLAGLAIALYCAVSLLLQLKAEIDAAAAQDQALPQAKPGSPD